MDSENGLHPPRYSPQLNPLNVWEVCVEWKLGFLVQWPCLGDSSCGKCPRGREVVGRPGANYPLILHIKPKGFPAASRR